MRSQYRNGLEDGYAAVRARFPEDAEYMRGYRDGWRSLRDDAADGREDEGGSDESAVE